VYKQGTDNAFLPDLEKGASLMKVKNLSQLRLLKSGVEFRPIKEVDGLPRLRRGIYVLYNRPRQSQGYDVVYVGMAADRSIRGRLREHVREKKGLWTHFSAFEVWDNITPAEVQELEGIFRHIYRKDSRAANLNVQRSFGKMKKLPQFE
jgi:hypothetical protein